jgi:hypothetical protein
MMAKALVVQSDHSRGFDAPSGVLRGSGEGAPEGMKDSLALSAGTGLGALLWLLLSPVVLPVSAAIGANLAHSEQEVDAAIAAFQTVGRDEEFLASIDRRFIRALGGETTKRWNCVASASATTQEPCPGMRPVARLDLRPAFNLGSVGKYDPDIYFFGDVVALASVDHAEADAKTDSVFEAKWAYREKLGTFFELAENDATVLRGKLEEILDRFTARMAEDIYLAPRPEIIEIEHRGHYPNYTEIPEGVVVRVDQGSDLASVATHGVVAPRHGSWNETCWIDAVEGKPTGQSFDTATSESIIPGRIAPGYHFEGRHPIHGITMANHIAVRTGRVRLVVSCSIGANVPVRFMTNARSINPKLEHHNIEISIEPGMIYTTDGRTYERFQCNPPHPTWVGFSSYFKPTYRSVCLPLPDSM